MSKKKPRSQVLYDRMRMLRRRAMRYDQLAKKERSVEARKVYAARAVAYWAGYKLARELADELVVAREQLRETNRR